MWMRDPQGRRWTIGIRPSSIVHRLLAIHQFPGFP
jgi:hypothetical protein